MWVKQVLERLSFVGVEVAELPAAVAVSDYRPYGREPRAAVVPAGTLLVRMEQGTKHYIQTMLHEQAYVPLAAVSATLCAVYLLDTPLSPVLELPVALIAVYPTLDVSAAWCVQFYDLSAWSAPLMENVGGGWSSDELAPDTLTTARTLNLTAVVEELRRTGAVAHSAALAERVVGGNHKQKAGSVVVLQQTANAGESYDWLAFIMRDVWGVEFTPMLPAEFASPGATFDSAGHLLLKYESTEIFDTIRELHRYNS